MRFIDDSVVAYILRHPCTVYRVAQKVSHCQMIKKIVLNRNKSLSIRLYLFVKLKYESSTIISFVGIRYSMRDLLSDLNNYA